MSPDPTPVVSARSPWLVSIPGGFMAIVTTQAEADDRIPQLLAMDVGRRAVKVYPKEAVRLSRWLMEEGDSGGFTQWDEPISIMVPTYAIDTVIVTGACDRDALTFGRPGAWPVHPAWVRRIRDDCEAADVPFAFSTWGRWLPYGDVNIPVMGEVDDMRWVGPDGSASAENVRPTPGHELMMPIGDECPWRVLDGRTHDLPEPITMEATHV